MANICDNHLSISGADPKALRELLAGTLTEGLGWLVPMPEFAPHPDQPKMHPELAKQGYQIETEERHRWIGENWGTSCIYWFSNAIELEIDSLDFHFQSPWTPPVRWVRAIAERWPTWQIRLTCQSIESAFHGHVSWDGEKWEEICEDYCPICGGEQHKGKCEPQDYVIERDGYMITGGRGGAEEEIPA